MAWPFGFALTDPCGRLSRTRLFPEATRIGISIQAAKFHVGQLIDKLDATGRSDAIAHAAHLCVLHL